MYVYQCEDSLESIFTAIYNAYENRHKPQDTVLTLSRELFLFAEYITVTADRGKVLKVMSTLKRRFGEEDYIQLCFALSSTDMDKAQAVYQTVAAGLANQCARGRLLDNLANPFVHKVFSLSRAAKNEDHHLRGFLRFGELESGILYAKIGPKNNLLTFLMPHFSDRFPNENFMIYDDNRSLFGIHPAHKAWYLVQSDQVLEHTEQFVFSENELYYQELFRHFCHKIAVEERKNLDLQRNMLPLRFQEYMVEFR